MPGSVIRLRMPDNPILCSGFEIRIICSFLLSFEIRRFNQTFSEREKITNGRAISTFAVFRSTFKTINYATLAKTLEFQEKFHSKIIMFQKKIANF